VQKRETDREKLMDGKSLLQKNITNNKTIIKFTDELREWFFLGE